MTERTPLQEAMEALRPRWDEWRGSMDGRPTMWIKRLLRFRGLRLDLHKMVRADDPDCFHTHPATAFRLILWGGYTEELHPAGTREWRPGMFGMVRPEFCHRISGLRNLRFSLSLWFRFPVTHKVILRGNGWPQVQTFRAPGTVFDSSPLT